ncbi:MAG: pyrimidine 5'-nucleotidase [Alphaproteobacteria bacterium]|nr:pyrimidine 5'-nucleotidase [Alphaproteobacteria bacterium]
MKTALHETRCWVFDLDNTLYPASCNLFVQVDRRIQQYIMSKFDAGPAEARRIQKSFFHEYGTTLNGLMLNHGVEPAEYLSYVHDIDVSPVALSPPLDRVLERLPGRKLVYTNGSVPHAERVMERLGVARHFAGVFDIVAAGYVPKPQPKAFDAFVKLYDVDPSSAVMVEDIARNLAPAHALGMTTVWIRSDHHWSGGSATDPHIHHVIDDLVDWLTGVADAMPPLP